MKGKFEIIPPEEIINSLPDNHRYLFCESVGNTSNGFYFDINETDNDFVL